MSNAIRSGDVSVDAGCSGLGHKRAKAVPPQAETGTLNLRLVRNLRWRCASGVAAVPLLALVLAGCSKTVHWEEEVPLNTGETIWVKRTVVYSLQGEPGNPLKIDYRPEWNERLEFKWNNRRYMYEGDADLMLLAISPQKQPVLVAPAGNKGWAARHQYGCTTPYYVQLAPDSGGSSWTWPKDIEPWLYRASHNLMRKRDKPELMLARYTKDERASMDAAAKIQFPSSFEIDPTLIDDYCRGRR